jgi:hypothetical protein
MKGDHSQAFETIREEQGKRLWEKPLASEIIIAL